MTSSSAIVKTAVAVGAQHGAAGGLVKRQVDALVAFGAVVVQQLIENVCVATPSPKVRVPAQPRSPALAAALPLVVA